MPLRFCRSEPGTQFWPARRSDWPTLSGWASRRCDQHQLRTADHDRGVSFGRLLVSVGSPLKQASMNGAVARLRELRANLAWAFALFARARQSAVTPIWRARLRLAIATAGGGGPTFGDASSLGAPGGAAAPPGPA